MTKRLFRQNHPILLGCLVLGGTFTIFLAGIAFFISTLLHAPGKSAFFASQEEGIGVLTLHGLIVSSGQALEDLTAFRHNPRVKAVIVRIDSPGGAVGASQEIYQELQRTNRVKPVIASLESVAASGGYYAALGAGRIIANPGTLTGSLGVIVKFPNLQAIFQKIGFHNEVIKSGELKDTGSMDRAMSPRERELLQNLIDNVHRQFVSAIAENRKLPLAAVSAFADGRIFSGEQAKELGLIDQLGNFTDAVLLAAKLAGIADEEPLLIYPEEKGLPFLRLLGGESAETLFNRLSQYTATIAYEWSLPH